MSVGVGMSAKGTRKGLNEAFKQFQRLPDWPVLDLTDGRGFGVATDEPEARVTRESAEAIERTSAGHAFTE